MSDAVHAFGVILRRNGTAIAEIADITPPQPERDAIEVTRHDGPNKYREFIPGLKDAGEIALTLNYVPSNQTHEDLFAAFESDNVDLYQVVFPTVPATTWQMSGFVRMFSPQAPIDDRLTIEAGIKISGKLDIL